MTDILKEITHEFDSNYGGLSLRLHTLNNVSLELNTISDDVLNTDKTNLTDMGLMFRDIDHKIEIIAELLHYTVNDLSEEMEKTRIIKESYFDLLVRKVNEKENTPRI